MTLKFYNISDDRRELVKTLVNTGADANLMATLSGNIKGDCSILDPTFEVSYNSDIMSSNYIYVPAFGRYYYITDITTSSQRLIISAHVDVLMSYADDIKKLSCIVARQEHLGNSNVYVADEKMRSLVPREWVPLPYPNEFYKAGSFVLCVGGGS